VEEKAGLIAEADEAWRVFNVRLTGFAEVLKAVGHSYLHTIYVCHRIMHSFSRSVTHFPRQSLQIMEVTVLA